MMYTEHDAKYLNNILHSFFSSVLLITLSMTLVLPAGMYGQDSVPPYHPTPQMEGFFTEDDRDLYQFDVLEEELQRRAEQNKMEAPPEEYPIFYSDDPSLSEIPRYAPTPQMEGFFTEDDRDLYRFEALEEEQQRRSEREEARRTPGREPLPPEKEKEAKRCQYPCGSRWCLLGPPALIIGAGIGFGYLAGRHGSWTRDVDVDEKSCFCDSEKEVNLSWIPPEGIDNGVVFAELYRPDQILYAQAEIDEMNVPPAVPSLGGAGNPSVKGIYLAVFTLTDAITTTGNGGFLGGIQVGGKEFRAYLFPAGEALEQGTQSQVFFSYP